MSEGSARCSQCGRWHVAACDARRLRVRLADVETGLVERIAVRSVGAAALGGGYPRGCVTLLGGEPGTGKSTLALQVASAVPSCLYVAAEEAETEIKLRAERLALVLPGVELVRAMGGVWIDSALAGPPCELVVLDSLPGLVGVGNNAGMMETLRALKLHADKNRSHVLVIDHATKDDWFAGRLAIQHDVDATVVLVAEGAQERLLVSVKNRHGPSGEKERLMMTATGLVPREEDASARRRVRGA